MNYPTPSDLIDMSLYSVAEQVSELQQKWPEMSDEQRRAFIEICGRIAEMEQAA